MGCGAGSGSIGIEWLRSAPHGRAIGIEPVAGRRAFAMENAEALGVPMLEIVEGRAPDALEGLSAPDAVFIGGGISTPGLVERCWEALRPGGRLVANVVTLEGETALAAALDRFGGEMARTHVERLEKAGLPGLALADGGYPLARDETLGRRRMSAGRLTGVGVGPGDPELLTLKAARLIGEADVIAYPATETGDSLARRIAAPHIPEGRVEIPIVIPIQTGTHPDERVYDAAAERPSGELATGRSVVVLCEGDPFFYGSFMYLFGRMAAKARVEVVRGVLPRWRARPLSAHRWYPGMIF